MRTGLLACAAGAVGVVCGAGAQSYSGNAQAGAACGPSLIHTYPGAEPGGLWSHGDCDFPNGLASINDGTASYLLTPGGFMFDTRAHTDFLGTTVYEGSASASSVLTFRASDVVFTDIANPASTANFGPFRYNFDFAFDAATQGVSNCSPFQHYAGVYFEAECGGGRASGSLAIQAGAVISNTDAFAGLDPGDTVYAAKSSESFQNLGTPKEFYFYAALQNSVLYCDHPPAAVGDSHSRLVWSLPCDRPVFDLPPGITVNSVQLGIVNNMRVPAIITEQPGPMTACPGGDAGFSVGASGIGPFAYEWQWKPAGGAEFIDVSEGVNTNPLTNAPAFAATGAHAAGVDLASCSRDQAGTFRCVITSTCGSVTSDEAAFAVCGADLNCDHVVDLSDFFDFLNCFDQTLPCADIDGNPGVDLGDFFAFFNDFDVSC